MALAARTEAWTLRRYPSFKSRKRSRRSAEYTTSAFRYRDGRLTLAKMAEPLDIVWSRPLPQGASPSTVTVSLLCDDRIEQTPASGAVGIDAGIDSLLTLSTGEKVVNPRHERRDRAALARAQRDPAREEKGSANRDRARVRVAHVHARITDRRRDHLHKLTTRLVRENQTIVIEDRTVRNMVKNHSLARAISDAAWRQFRIMVEYRADWYGRNLVVVDRWFPSSRLCLTCGARVERMPLNVRTWTCLCGQTHDRDVNAARPIAAPHAADAGQEPGADISRGGVHTGSRSKRNRRPTMSAATSARRRSSA
jgi:putative transposase